MSSIKMTESKENRKMLHKSKTPEFVRLKELHVDWIKANVKKKECAKFVKISDGNTVDDSLCHCGRMKKGHTEHNQQPLMESDVTEWTTEHQPTDAYGELEFCDNDNQVAKFVRVSDDQDAKKILETLLVEKWNLQKPNLLISVTGGAQNFDMKSRLKEEFRRGLQKAAESTGAWIVTGGTNTGVMKHVGEAMKEISITDESNKVVAIGVAPWGCIRNKKELIQKKQSNQEDKKPYEYKLLKPPSMITNEIFLNPNHTHFLLVDNGTEHKWGTEIHFRTALEKAISEGIGTSQGSASKEKIPVVLLVLQGGPGTFKTIAGAIANETPTVVIKDSGGAADILAHAYQWAYPSEYKGYDKESEKVTGTVMTLDVNVQEELNKMMELQYGKKISKADTMKTIQEIIAKKHLLTVFELHSRNSTQSVDMAILKALMKGTGNENTVMHQLQLALVWDKINVAKKDILGDDQVDKKNLNLSEKMLTAIKMDRVSFVDLFIDHGVNLKQFVTADKLIELYREIPENCVLKHQLNQTLNKHDKSKTIMFSDIYNLLQSLLGDYYAPYYKDSAYKPKKPTQFQESSISQPGPTEYNSDRPTDHPVQDLFIWSLLMNRQEMAKLFWSELDEPIAAALFANSLYKSMKTRSKDSETSVKLQNNADEFEKFAIDVLYSCYEKDEDKSQSLLTRVLPNWGKTTCVTMAVAADNKRFISQTACQTLLKSIWMGKLCPSNSVLRILASVLFFPLIWLMVKFDEKKILKTTETEPGSSGDTNENQSCCKSCTCVTKLWTKLKYFYLTPAVIFYLNVLTYLVFLGLYSYHLLISFDKEFTVIEGIICGWVVTIFVEEIRQVYTSNAISVGSKLKTYFKDSWNILDIVTIILFVLGLILRFIPNDVAFEIGRVVLCLNLVSFYFRILHIFSVNKQLGPKLVMIRRMVQDLMSFVVILAVFIVAYAVATEAILYPNSELSWKLLYHVVRKAYWQIYGELFLEDIEGQNPCTSDRALYSDYQTLRCPSETGKYLAPIFMGVYVLMTNVLLLNLLIAMFSYTFQKIQDNTDLHWYFQRYQLIHEYYSRPFLPPPAIIIVHVYLILKFFKDKCSDSIEENSDFRKDYHNNQVERQLIAWESVMGAKYRNKEDQASIQNVHQRYTNVLSRLEGMASTEKDVQEGSDLRESGNLENRIQAIEQNMEITSESLDWIMKSLVEHKMASKSLPPTLTDIQKRRDKEKRRAMKKKLRNQQLRGFFKADFKLHNTCRNVPYPSGQERAYVKDEEVLWMVKFPNYNPRRYTNDKSYTGKPYDKIDLLDASEEEKSKFQFNAFDKNFDCDRRSICGHEYEIKNGLPLNPRGRTGLQGRGDLCRWGPNFTIDCIVTRWKKDEDENIEIVNDKQCLEFIAVKRSDSSGQFAIPGGFVSVKTTAEEALLKIFAAEALGYEKKDAANKKKIDENLSKLAKMGEVIYEGYADDRRNTDNAWIESCVFYFHDEEGTLANNLPISAGESTSLAAWMTVTSSISFWGNHKEFLSLVADKLKADF